MIPKDTVNRIIDTAEIVDVVSDFVSLKKRGANYLGLCPFHNEKSPSFTVSAAKGIYKCFGCGKSGTPVNFIMEHEQLSYPEALRFLARKYSIKIEEEEQTADQIKEQNAKESMLLLSTYAQATFTDYLLHTDEGKAIGLSYFKERGFTQSTIDKFQLGYSSEARKTFTDKALKDGYLMEYLSKTGLTIEKEDYYFDRFAGRVMFPIHNLSGRVIAFGGRILTNDKKQAKYLNSPESDIYHKSSVLYGIYFAKRSMVEKNNCFLVEGYTDVIQLVQAGVENVVASAGTSLTPEQIRLVRRFTKNITILYDGDNAGIKASFRGIDLILAEGMNVKVLLFPNGEDPDSFARKTPHQELVDFIAQNTTDFITFKTKLLLDETKNDPMQKAQLIHEIVESISLMPDSIARSLYVKDCSRMMKIEEQLLITELNKVLRKARLKQTGADPDSLDLMPDATVQTEPKQPVTEHSELDTEYQEKDIIRLLLNYGHHEIDVTIMNENNEEEITKVLVATLIYAEMENNTIFFENEVHQSIFDEYKNIIDNLQVPNSNSFASHENKTVQETSINLITPGYELSDNWQNKYHVTVPREDDVIQTAVHQAINKIKLKKVLKLIHDNTEKIKTATNDDEIQNLLIELTALHEAKVILSAESGTVISH